MDLVHAMSDKPAKRKLGEDIMKHAEDLLADGKVSDGQYLDFCNGAGLIHQCVMMTPKEAVTVAKVINTMCRKIDEGKAREAKFRKHIKALQRTTKDLHIGLQNAKSMMLNNVVSLESAIQKKAYARARTMIKDQKKMASDLVFDFDE